MAEKKKTISKTADHILKSAAGGATGYGILELLGGEKMGKIFKHIKVGLLGIGPNDEALYNKIKASLSVDEVELLADFVSEMIKRGYSFWWFRNVMATLQADFEIREGESRRDSPAVQRALQIIAGFSWEDQLKLAGPSMLKKRFASKLVIAFLWVVATGCILIFSCSKIFP